MTTSPRNDLVVALHTLTRAEAPAAGLKATTLATLTQAGVAVPEGLVLTAGAAIAALAGLDRAATPEQLLVALLPDRVDAALAEVAAHFGGVALAVRSSAVNTDVPVAPYAGRYGSVLGVRGLPALRDAVRRCWAAAYGALPNIAVLVQRQVDIDVAGVASSASPLTAAVGEVLISAVPGLADPMVSGAEPPDEWVVCGAEADAVRVIHGALTAAQARKVAGLARHVQTLLDEPVDVEWAMADGRLLVMQAPPRERWWKVGLARGSQLPAAAPRTGRTRP